MKCVGELLIAVIINLVRKLKKPQSSSNSQDGVERVEEKTQAKQRGGGGRGDRTPSLLA